MAKRLRIDIEYQDDLAPDTMEALMDALAGGHESGIVYINVCEVDRAGYVTGRFVSREFDDKGILLAQRRVL